MFDKLIVSDEQGAEFKGRRRYFMVSTFVVGILFITAVVFSLYAADIGLGSDEFEVSMMIAPLAPDAPEPPKPLQPENEQQANKSEVPIRSENMLRPEESPSAIPTEISVKPNTGKARPYGDFEVRFGHVETDGNGAPGNERTAGVPDGSSSSAVSNPVAAVEKIPDPPPVIVPKPPAKAIVSEGVINGKATFLPAPPYPKPAQMVNAYGAVNVQVTIDETGKVISSKAVSGHPLLKQAAETAAWRAKFSPTLLSKVPVKVTGVIVYNFKRS